MEDIQKPDSSLAEEIRFARLLALSYALCGGSILIEQTLSWTDHWKGAMNGLTSQMFVFFGWCLWMFPWSLAIWGIYRWRKWNRYRSAWVLTLPLLYACWILGTMVVYPPTARGSFRRFAEAEMPSDARRVSYHLWGGLMADYSISYYFECSPKSLAKLIIDMRVGEGLDITSEYGPNMVHIGRLPSPPDISQWIGGKYYSRETEGWTFYLVTDPTETKVYVWMSCI